MALPGRNAGTDQGITVFGPWPREFQKASARGKLGRVALRGAKATEPCIIHYNTTASRYVPKTSLSAAQISPNVAFAFTASIKNGIKFS